MFLLSFRYCFEIGTLLSTFAFIFFQLGEEIKNAGPKSFWRNLKASPPKILFVVANIMIMLCIPIRVIQSQINPNE